jgi:hypothetical protein
MLPSTLVEGSVRRLRDGDRGRVCRAQMHDGHLGVSARRTGEMAIVS